MTPTIPPERNWARVSNPVTPKVLTFGGPPADSPETPRTELLVQLTIAAEAHPNDVAAAMNLLHAAGQEAQAATGGRIEVRFALPEVVRSV